MKPNHKRYVWVLIACLGAMLAPIFTANFFLLSNSYGNKELISLASQWQQQTRGNTFAGGAAPPDGHRLFKVLRLHDRIPEINTVILGSSTVMGISQSAFPERFKVYNFATNSNPLYSVIGEAEYIQKHMPSVKWLIIPMDWALSFIYWTYPPSVHDLSLSSAMQQIKSDDAKVRITERMRDAMSYPRIVSLLNLLKLALRSNNKTEAIRNIFSIIGSEYICPDGALGKDFDPTYRGKCAGFRFDGSSPFATHGRVGGKVQSTIRNLLDPNWQYSVSLRLTNGVPNSVLLERLVNIDQQAKKNGGGVIFILPPMLSGLEAEFLRHPQAKDFLIKTKSILGSWADRNHLHLIDAGQAERFGCTADEFVDGHHAVDTCYRKIFQNNLPL